MVEPLSNTIMKSLAAGTQVASHAQSADATAQKVQIAAGHAKSCASVLNNEAMPLITRIREEAMMQLSDQLLAIGDLLNEIEAAGTRIKVAEAEAEMLGDIRRQLHLKKVQKQQKQNADTT